LQRWQKEMEIKMCNNGKNKQSLINVYTLSGWKWVAAARTKRVNDAGGRGWCEVGAAASAADKRRSNSRIQPATRAQALCVVGTVWYSMV